MTLGSGMVSGPKHHKSTSAIINKHQFKIPNTNIKVIVVYHHKEDLKTHFLILPNRLGL